MSVSAIQASSVSQPAAAPEKAAASHGFSFHALLSALNPLRYLPVVGTIYRAATGDVIPEGLRYAGSMLASGLLGGPIGLLSNVALIIGEKATGIDPEKIVAAQFHKTAPEAATVTPPNAAPAPPVVASVSAAPQLA